MNTLADPAVVVERRAAIWTFRLNRPDQRNAIDPEVSRLMNRWVGEFEADAHARVGIIAANGDGVFCAGADLKAIASGRLNAITQVEPYGFAGVVRGERRKPLIAAVDGLALAGGFEIALACDLIVASRRAAFALPEVSRGIIAGAGGLQRLPLLAPVSLAMELALTGRRMSAQEAHDRGLIAALVEPGAAERKALELAESIAANAPLAVSESRAVIRTAIAAGERDAWRRAERAWDVVLASEDAKEGPRAFAEKRAPVWTGR
jgi:enoyl-CoA hydratase/carnithine racemase